MKINISTYEALTPHQRIVSMIDGMGRDDQPEIKKLRETYEKKTYSMNNSDFSDVLDHIFHIAMSLEPDLREFVIDHQSTEDDELKKVILQKLTDHNTAWLKLIEEIGVNKESMMKTANFRHPSIDYYLDDTLKLMKIM